MKKLITIILALIMTLFSTPKKEQYIASFYNAEEVKQLLELVKDDEIYIPILLAAYYGLRRHESRHRRRDIRCADGIKGNKKGLPDGSPNYKLIDPVRIIFVTFSKIATRT